MIIKNRLLPIFIFMILSGCSSNSNELADQSEDQDSQASDEIASETPNNRLSELAKKGKVSFLKCRSCHAVSQGEPHSTGPNLHGFYDGKAGTREGYVYSEALLASGITWNDAALDAWIEKPTAAIPGTKMVFAGIANQEERKALIAYMREIAQ